VAGTASFIAFGDRDTAVNTFRFMIISKQLTHAQLLHCSTTPCKPFYHDHHSADAGRADRILHIALAVGPDPLHLSLVFNLSHTAASRYARLVEQFLGFRVAPVAG
jgi:hypothetical protein